MMEILDLQNAGKLEEYEQFVLNHPVGTFMQSARWAQVKPSWGREIILSRGEDGAIRGGVQVLIRRLPLCGRSLLYAPRGPVCDLHRLEVLTDLMVGVHLLAKLHRAYRFTFDPYTPQTDSQFLSLAKELGCSYRRQQKDLTTFQCKVNYMLDLQEKSREQILAGFTQKCRYNLRLAQKSGVECRVCGVQGLEDFYRLMVLTGQRDDFAVRPKEYFQRMLAALGEHCRLYLCFTQGRAVSGAIAVQYAGKTCYVYGASDNDYRSRMPNYLMQWEMISWALESGCHTYDFQSAAFYQDQGSRYYGIYRFKKGFGGQIVDLVGDVDYIYSPVIHTLVQIGRAAAVRLQRLTRNKKAGAPKSPALLQRLHRAYGH